MRASFASFGASVLVLLLQGCHSSETRLTPPAAIAQASIRQQVEQGSIASTAISDATARYWVASCQVCGIRLPTTNVAVNVYTRTGALVKAFWYDNAPGQGLPLIVTNPDQKHVYVTIDLGHQDYIADIDTLTYAERYYKLPVLDTQGVTGLFTNIDGSRLYAVTTAGTYAINTIARTYAGSFAPTISYPALSSNGQSIYGVVSGKLTAVSMTSFTSHTIAPDPGTLGLAASAQYLYSGSMNGVLVYALPSGARAKTILSGLYENLLADAAAQRLYATYNGPTEADLSIVNTTTNQTVTTLRNWYGGPFLDAATHSIYGYDISGRFCEYSLPSYSQNCLFTINASTALNIAITH